MSRRPLALLAEGWWVLIPTAGLVALAVLLVRAPAGDPTSAARTGDGRTVMSYGFDLESCSVDPAELTPSGMPRDGLPTLIDPDTIDAAEIERRNREERGKLLVPGDRVAGLVVGGEARAYPLRLLRWHEVVNDTLGGVPILISYNPLCDSVVAAERVGRGEELVFASSGLVLDSNLLLFDRRRDPSASSLWSQIDARSLCGPLAGAQLRLLPAELTSWEQWRKRHPDTRALAPSPEHQRKYRRDPYHSYFGSDLLRFPVSPLPPVDTGPRLKDRVVIIDLDGSRGVYALPHLATAAGADSGSWATRLGGVTLRIEYDLHLGTAAIEIEDPESHSLAVRHAFWFAWFARHPDTVVLPEL